MPQSVLVTSCSTGIGLAVATHLAARGVHVFGTVRSDADAARLARIDGVEALICDVTDDAQVTHLRATIAARGEGLWGIVHNAGNPHLGHLTTTSVDDTPPVTDRTASARCAARRTPPGAPASR